MLTITRNAVGQETARQTLNARDDVLRQLRDADGSVDPLANMTTITGHYHNRHRCRRPTAVTSYVGLFRKRLHT